MNTYELKYKTENNEQYIVYCNAKSNRQAAAIVRSREPIETIYYIKETKEEFNKYYNYIN